MPAVPDDGHAPRMKRVEESAVSGARLGPVDEQHSGMPARGKSGCENQRLIGRQSYRYEDGAVRVRL
jgi:hypothetical protein